MDKKAGSGQQILARAAASLAAHRAGWDNWFASLLSYSAKNPESSVRALGALGAPVVLV